ncbi:MAG TPA: S-layer homology domain-containing protein [Thermoanaerobaculia bacterium]|nr:S-layer homology domain-containing protein [Thermoanaerobaculia bacterium]
MSGRFGVLAGLGLGFCAAGLGLPVEAAPAPAWGTVALSTYTVSALEFSTYLQGEAWNPVLGTAGRYLVSPLGQFVAPLHLPQGASVQAVEVEGCDASASGSLTGSFFSAPSPAGSAVDLADFDTGVAATPGCALFPVTVSPPVTIDNEHNVYFLGLGNTPGDGTTFFVAVRVRYQLQVSNPPTTPDFNDVPTSHPFYREIEALFQAGITSGCGGGNFCPNNPLTRAQAAAFFAKALGLYWPN